MIPVKPSKPALHLLTAVAVALYASVACASDCVTTAPDKSIVFFQLDQAEYDTLNAAKKREAEAVLYDFHYYASQAREHLEAGGIRVIFTTCDTIRTATKGEKKDFHKKSLADYCGSIFVKKGEEPKIVPDVMTDGEIINEAEKFFGAGSSNGR